MLVNARRMRPPWVGRVGKAPLYRTLISLYHQQEMSYEEIAQITSLPDGTVKNYLFRARKMLKQYLLASYQRDDL